MSNSEIRQRLTKELLELELRAKKLRDQFPREEACCTVACFDDADWVRSTQFSGDHFFCDKHAREEEDFGKEDPSYFYWSPVKEFVEIQRRSKERLRKEARKMLGIQD